MGVASSAPRTRWGTETSETGRGRVDTDVYYFNIKHVRIDSCLSFLLETCSSLSLVFIFLPLLIEKCVFYGKTSCHV